MQTAPDQERLDQLLGGIQVALTHHTSAGNVQQHPGPQSNPFRSSALFLVIPGTATRSSSVAARMPSSEPKALSSARLRLGPMPGISSRVDLTADLARRPR